MNKIKLGKRIWLFVTAILIAAPTGPLPYKHHPIYEITQPGTGVQNQVQPAPLGPIWGENLFTSPDLEVEKFEKFEISFTVNVPVDTNVFNPDEIQVDGKFISPAGQEYTQPGFFYEEYVPNYDGMNIDYPSAANECFKGYKCYKPSDPPAKMWKVRFSPREVGVYQYWVEVRIRQGNPVVSNPGAFTVIDSAHPGFIRRSTTSPRYFEFETGAPFYGIGLDVGWWQSNKRRLSTYFYYFDRMNEQGANLARVWMTNGVTNAGWIMSVQDKQLGDNYNLEEAWAFDQILERAQDKGVYFILTLDDWVQYSPAFPRTWMDNNLYNSAEIDPECPCPISKAQEIVFEKESARKYQKQLYRYIVARWGYSPNILTWELFNEGPKDELGGPQPVQNWYHDVHDYIEGIDVHNHLANYSTNNYTFEAERWKVFHNREDVDIAEEHISVGWELMPGLSSVEAYQTAAYSMTAVLVPPKPAIMGEFGDAQNLIFSDDQGLILHDGLWTFLMSGLAASGLSWRWPEHEIFDSGWWNHYGAIANYVAGLETTGLEVIRPENFETASSLPDTRPALFDSSNPRLGVLGLRRGGNTIYAWIKNKDFTWCNYVNEYSYTGSANNGVSWCNYVNPINQDSKCVGLPEPGPQAGQITIHDLPPGSYRVEWWDTYQSDSARQVMRSEKQVVGASQEMVLVIPPLKRDIAVKIIPSDHNPAVELHKEVDQETVSFGDPVLITTWITNTGDVELNISIQDSACGSGVIGLLAQGDHHEYACSVIAATDFTNSVVVTSTPPVGSPFVRREMISVAVRDTVIGSGIPESCTEAALFSDLSVAGGGTITFNCDPGHRTPIYMQNTINIPGQVTIDGVDQVILSGRNRIRLLDVNQFASLDVQNIFIVNGFTDVPVEPRGGGAFRNLGDLNLSNVRLIGNRADWGGAIRNQGGTLTITDSQLLRNAAGHEGGAIYNEGVLTLTNSMIGQSWASGGGAIINWKTGSVEIFQSRLIGNFAKNVGGAIQNGWGENQTTSVKIHNGSEIAANEALLGGGVYNGTRGVFEISQSSMTENKAIQNGGSVFNAGGWLTFLSTTIGRDGYGNCAVSGGGGLVNTGAGVVQISASTFNSNRAGYSGAIQNGGDGNITLKNSTISGNSAVNQGGGIRNIENGEIVISNATFSNNSAMTGGGIWNQATGGVTIDQSILSGSPTGGNCAGTITSMGYNLEDSNTCHLTGLGDLTNIDPLLGPLQYNGGPTWTYALLPGSPALDRVPEANCSNGVDQRGVDRPQGSNCDTGSYEAIQVSIQDASATELSGGGTTINFQVTLSTPSPGPVTLFYMTYNGTALAGEDFLTSSGTITIPPDGVDAIISVPLVNDWITEPDETFILRLSDPVNAVIHDNSAVGTIHDNDNAWIHLPFIRK